MSREKKLSKPDMFAALSRCYAPDPILGVASQVLGPPRFATPEEEQEIDKMMARQNADWPPKNSQKRRR